MNRTKFAFLYAYLKLHLKEGTISEDSYDKIISILVKEDNNGKSK